MIFILFTTYEKSTPNEYKTANFQLYKEQDKCSELNCHIYLIHSHLDLLLFQLSRRHSITSAKSYSTECQQKKLGCINCYNFCTFFWYVTNNAPLKTTTSVLYHHDVKIRNCHGSTIQMLSVTYSIALFL